MPSSASRIDFSLVCAGAVRQQKPPSRSIREGGTVRFTSSRNPGIRWWTHASPSSDSFPPHLPCACRQSCSIHCDHHGYAAAMVVAQDGDALSGAALLQRSAGASGGFIGKLFTHSRSSRQQRAFQSLASLCPLWMIRALVAQTHGAT